MTHGKVELGKEQSVEALEQKWKKQLEDVESRLRHEIEQKEEQHRFVVYDYERQLERCKQKRHRPKAGSPEQARYHKFDVNDCFYIVVNLREEGQKDNKFGMTDNINQRLSSQVKDLGTKPSAWRHIEPMHPTQF